MKKLTKEVIDDMDMDFDKILKNHKEYLKYKKYIMIGIKIGCPILLAIIFLSCGLPPLPLLL